MSKLSASAINTFIRSPKLYYWKYILQLTPVQQSVVHFDHDLIFGQEWAVFVDDFYKRKTEESNIKDTMTRWVERADSWVPEKMKAAKTKALESLMPQYYQQFSPEDGARAKDKSELWLENDVFVAKLDGLSDDGVVHEVKSTSRAPNLTEQLWKVAHSTQVKLYAVLAKASGICIEFAFKDSPYQLFRGPVLPVTDDDLHRWDLELRAVANHIASLGTDPNNFLCTSECNLVTRGMVAPCAYQVLCDIGYNEVTSIAYKRREPRK